MGYFVHMKFSQRVGKTEIRTLIQRDDMDDSLKNRLFNIISEILESCFTYEYGIKYVEKAFLADYCDEFAVKTTDLSSRYQDFIGHINSRVYVNNDIWFFYNFIEWIVSLEFNLCEEYVKKLNLVLEAEKSAYRIGSDYKLISITDEVEMDGINDALEKAEKYASVSIHLRNARSEFSKRQTPNYKSVVHESILAIEALSKIISGDENATLETALKKIPNLNTNLKESLQKLYHFRGDEGGIGHGSKNNQENTIQGEEAKLILVTSHSVVNYLISKFL